MPPRACQVSLGRELDDGTPAHLTAPRERGTGAEERPQAVQGSIRTGVGNSFSLEEWSGIVISCLWRWWSHHPWQRSRGSWVWRLGCGYGEIVVVLGDLEGLPGSMLWVLWPVRALSTLSLQVLHPCGRAVPRWALLGGTAAHGAPYIHHRSAGP